MTLRIAALASGTGTNVANILRHIEEGRLDAEVCLVASNKPDAPVVEHVRAKGIAVWAKDHKSMPDRESFDAALADAVEASGADTVVLAGYMRILSAGFIRRFPGRILNIHPAILPSFPGAHGGPDAAAYGVRLTGCTVHFVDEIMDNGPIIIQAAVPVFPGEEEDGFMPAVHAMEYRIYPQALQWLAEGRLHVEGRRVLLAPSEETACFTGEAKDRPSLVSPPLEGF